MNTSGIDLYIVTCDKTSWILKATVPLLEKYWNIPKSVKVLGYTKPNIPYEFISMGESQVHIDNWCRDIYSILKDQQSEYLILMLDDFFAIDYVQPDILQEYLSLMKRDRDIVRCGIGNDAIFWPYSIIKDKGGYKIIQKIGGPYHISTQTSLWRKDYLLSILKRSTSPWHFETGNKPDGKKVISSLHRYAFRWVAESALSSRHPGTINILGMPFEDIKWLIDEKIFDPETLQYGHQATGTVPMFKEYGYDFNLSVMDEYTDKKFQHRYRINYYNEI